MISKDKILEGRKVIDGYIKSHAELHSRDWGENTPIEHSKIERIMLSKLKELGFESLQDFYSANSDLCYAELKQCISVVGNCDVCQGREMGCIESCHGRYSHWEYEGFYHYREFGGTPPGCNLKITWIKEPSFDIYWGMPRAISTKEYARIKRYEREMRCQP